MQRVAAVLAATLAAVAAAGLGLRLYMDRPAENRLRPGEDIEIAELRGRLPANAALACPPGYCHVVGAIASPVFAVGADRLYDDLEQVARRERGVVPVAAEPARRRLVVIVHSAVLRFPDYVIAEVVALDRQRSSVALYSRARYGRLDFGVNRRRIRRWLSRLRMAQ